MSGTKHPKRGYRAVLPLLLCCLFFALLTLRQEERSVFSLSSVSSRLSAALEDARSRELQGLAYIRKTYRLEPGTLAPEPDPEGYCILHSADEVLALLDKASLLLNGREPFFNADTPFDTEKGVRCYYDESILTLLWYQRVVEEDIGWGHDATMAEVFLSDASQLRRKLSGDVFGSELLKYPTDMALEVNAVLASSGDFYRYRAEGLCIYEGQLCRLNGNTVDTCAFDDQGNMLFIPAGTLRTEEQVNAYIAENHVRFTLSFGPILVENYETVSHEGYYTIGEAHERYPRLLLAQRDELHYLEMAIRDQTTAFAAGEIMRRMGVERCYTLDGGQTATLVMEGTALNPGLYGQGNGAQRTQSDIFYFVSAIGASERSG